MPLKDMQIRLLKPASKIYTAADDRGLYLEIHPNGSKLWRYKYRHVGKQKRIALGRKSIWRSVYGRSPPSA